ncbi:MAG TPA: hypothetical protein VNX47_05865 [Nevskia sp.]|jgi:hypothetical protein|nr:hypothetical protein [Nevskia sp.]
MTAASNAAPAAAPLKPKPMFGMVDDWRQSWRWMSVRLSVLFGLIAEIADFLPDGWQQYVHLPHGVIGPIIWTIALARIIKKRKTAVPPAATLENCMNLSIFTHLGALVKLVGLVPRVVALVEKLDADPATQSLVADIKADLTEVEQAFGGSSTIAASAPAPTVAAAVATPAPKAG